MSTWHIQWFFFCECKIISKHDIINISYPMTADYPNFPISTVLWDLSICCWECKSHRHSRHCYVSNPISPLHPSFSYDCFTISHARDKSLFLLHKIPLFLLSIKNIELNFFRWHASHFVNIKLDVGKKNYCHYLSFHTLSWGEMMKNFVSTQDFLFVGIHRWKLTKRWWTSEERS